VEDRSWEKRFHDLIVDVRPKVFNLVILARRMNAIGEQYDVAIFLEIPPNRTAGESQVTDRAG
jgi:hypothetical protein